MTVIKVDIWNTQSGVKAKGLIYKYFNVGSYIAIVHRTNINLGVS